MNYKKISPLGPREGFGTCDTFYRQEAARDEAYENADMVIVDFVEDYQGAIYLQGYHTAHPDDKVQKRLIIQHFPFGIDIADDQQAQEIASELFKKYPK